MTGEHIDREDLVDMFATFPQDFRQKVLAQLESAIAETKEESEATFNQDLVDKSLRNLKLMKECCEQAENEYTELYRKHDG